jgi:excinuclease UvrABC nuclease subunit
MVVFEDGKAKRSDYKRFKIKHQEGNNDFLSMQEVVRRRFTRALAATPGTERMGERPEADAFAETAGSYQADLSVEPYPHAEGSPLPPTPSPLRGRGGDGQDGRPLSHGRERRSGGEGSISLPLLNGNGASSNGFRPTIEDDETAGEDARSRLDGGLEAAYADTHGTDDDAAGRGAGGAWGVFPDLVIIDGGKGQLSAAVEVMDSLELSEIPIVGLAKEREEIFQKRSPEPVILPRNSQGLYLVQRVRDEAHRFAITYHRNIRGKKSLRSQLDDVSGVGPARKKALLRQFGSVKALRGASVEELAAVPGMTRRTAEELKRALAE